MPYIRQEDRSRFSVMVSEIALIDDRNIVAVGDLNYLLSKILHIWLSHNGVSYTNLNAAIGVLECAKLELYRQIAAPYEDTKKSENGCISSLDVP